MKGVLLVMADDLATLVEDEAAADLARLERLLSAHAGFVRFLQELPPGDTA